MKDIFQGFSQLYARPTDFSCARFPYNAEITRVNVMSCRNYLDQGWANYGPRDHFMRPAGTYRNISSYRESSRRPFFFAHH